MEDNFPAWLKAIQNGSIGEARTRSFLLDRFWVLERSVDIEGADFIIQRRITSVNLLDKSPPRFGIVQAKFFASPKTTHDIHLEYLSEKDGTARKEFFLICHTGSEEDARSFLLTADDLVTDFVKVNGQVRVPASTLLASAQYEIKSKKYALDRMERALAFADFTKNRTFLSMFLPNARLDKNNIDPIYLEPIDNWWGDIPEGFFGIKQKIQTALLEIEYLHHELVTILESSDPEKALSMAEDIYHSLRSGYGLCIRLPEDMYNEDLHRVVLQHKKQVLTLKSCGLLDTFLSLTPMLKRMIAIDLAKHMPLDKQMIYCVNIQYDPKTFQVISVIGDVKAPEAFSPLSEEEGRSCYSRHWWIDAKVQNAIIFYSEVSHRMFGNKEENENWEEYFFKKDLYYVRHILDEIYERRFGED